MDKNAKQDKLDRHYRRLMIPLSSAVRGAVATASDSPVRLRSVELNVKCMATELTAEHLLNQMESIDSHLKSIRDDLSELGEMESLRLQMAMDRMSKMMSTLSNLLKKTSETAQSITKNLK